MLDGVSSVDDIGWDAAVWSGGQLHWHHVCWQPATAVWVQLQLCVGIQRSVLSEQLESSIVDDHNHEDNHEDN